MPVRQGPLTTVRSARGAVTYEVELACEELHKVRVVKGTDPDFVRRKAAVQVAEWQEQWSRKQEVLSRSHDARVRSELREERKHLADERLPSRRACPNKEGRAFLLQALFRKTQCRCPTRSTMTLCQSGYASA
jgi:hypothetical protein